jgi:sec-independent protein translocase protein TatA
MMPNVGMGEIALLLIVALVLFGPHKLPEMMRSLGKGIRDFKEAASGFDPMAPSTPPPPAAPLHTPVDTTPIDPNPFE